MSKFESGVAEGKPGGTVVDGGKGGNSLVAPFLTFGSADLFWATTLPGGSTKALAQGIERNPLAEFLASCTDCSSVRLASPRVCAPAFFNSRFCFSIASLRVAARSLPAPGTGGRFIGVD